MIVPEINLLVEKILHHFAGDEFKDEVQLAKVDFFENAGVLDEMADHYEFRMSQFFDWYFFTRNLKGFAKTPLEAAQMTRELRFTDRENELIEKLRQHRHSLFLFLKEKKGDLIIKDLFKKNKVLIKQVSGISGFQPEEIFEARLVPYEDSFVFMKGFCFHPSSVSKYILSEVKKYQKDKDLDFEELMLKLIKMRYRFERYRHVKAEKIYTNDTRLGPGDK